MEDLNTFKNRLFVRDLYPITPQRQSTTLPTGNRSGRQLPLTLEKQTPYQRRTSTPYRDRSYIPISTMSYSGRPLTRKTIT